MTIRAKLDGVEKEINEIEPIMREIDIMAARILALMPNFDGKNFDAVLPLVPELKTIHGPLVERIVAVRKWNEKGHCDFALDMWRLARDWQAQRS